MKDKRDIEVLKQRRSGCRKHKRDLLKLRRYKLHKFRMRNGKARGQEKERKGEDVGRKNEQDKKRGDCFEHCRSVRIESEAASCKP